MHVQQEKTVGEMRSVGNTTATPCLGRGSGCVEENEKHKRSQIGLKYTKSSFSTVCLRLCLSFLAKTNKSPHSSCHKWCTKPCSSSPVPQFGDMDKVYECLRCMGFIKTAYGALCTMSLFTRRHVEIFRNDR